MRHLSVFLLAIVPLACGGNGGGSQSLEDRQALPDAREDGLASKTDKTGGEGEIAEDIVSDHGVAKEVLEGEVPLSQEDGLGEMAGEQEVPEDFLEGPDQEVLEQADSGSFLPCHLGTEECPEGTHCAIVGASDTLGCVPYGAKEEGAICKPYSTECEKGSVCVLYYGDVGLCKRLCSEALSCPKDFQICEPWFGEDGTVAGICVGSDCTPPAEGCHEGQRCEVVLDMVFDCFPAGPVEAYGDCSEKDCKPGLVCRLGDYDTPLCLPYCKKAEDCPEPDTHCVYPWHDFTDFGHCMPGCDPVLQEGCPQGQGCYYADLMIGKTLCFDAGKLEAGADCTEMIEMCKPGYDCVLDPGSTYPYTYHCRAWCDKDHPCEQGTCLFTFFNPTIGFCY